MQFPILDIKILSIMSCNATAMINREMYTNISIKYNLIIVSHKQSKVKIYHEPNLHKKEFLDWRTKLF